MNKGYNLKISTAKTKIMAFKEKHLVRFKIEIDGSILEKVRQFNFFGMRTAMNHTCWIAGKHYHSVYKQLQVDVCGRLESYIFVFNWPTWYCWAGLIW